MHQRGERRLGSDPAVEVARAPVVEPRGRPEAVAAIPVRLVPADAAARSRRTRDYRPSLVERLEADPRFRRAVLSGLATAMVVAVALACALAVRMPPAVAGPALGAPRTTDAGYVRRVLTTTPAGSAPEGRARPAAGPAPKGRPRPAATGPLRRAVPRG